MYFEGHACRLINTDRCSGDFVPIVTNWCITIKLFTFIKISFVIQSQMAHIKNEYKRTHKILSTAKPFGRNISVSTSRNCYIPEPYCRPQGNFFTGVCLCTIGLMATRLLLGLVMAGSVRILLECFLFMRYYHTKTHGSVLCKSSIEYFRTWDNELGREC